MPTVEIVRALTQRPPLTICVVRTYGQTAHPQQKRVPGPLCADQCRQRFVRRKKSYGGARISSMRQTPAFDAHLLSICNNIF